MLNQSQSRPEPAAIRRGKARMLRKQRNSMQMTAISIAHLRAERENAEFVVYVGRKGAFTPQRFTGNDGRVHLMNSWFVRGANEPRPAGARKFSSISAPVLS